MCSFFFFNDTATTEIYTLSLHDALPIFCVVVVVHERAQPIRAWRSRRRGGDERPAGHRQGAVRRRPLGQAPLDRKSTRLNSSHVSISYAVFCLKKKNKRQPQPNHSKKAD